MQNRRLVQVQVLQSLAAHQHDPKAPGPWRCGTHSRHTSNVVGLEQLSEATFVHELENCAITGGRGRGVDQWEGSEGGLAQGKQQQECDPRRTHGQGIQRHTNVEHDVGMAK